MLNTICPIMLFILYLLFRTCETLIQRGRYKITELLFIIG